MITSFGVIHFGRLTPALEFQRDLSKKIKQIMATLNEVTADLQAATQRLVKIYDEVRGVQSSVDVLKTRVAELEAIIANGEAPQALVDALAALKTQVGVVDDAIPDVPAPPAPTV